MAGSIICNILNEILGSLRSLLPQLDPIWDSFQSEVDAFCAQFENNVA
jgi:hypothetical protein